MSLHDSTRPPAASASSPGVAGPGLARCRRPALSERNPRLFAAGVVAANVLDAWMRRKGITNAELAEVWEVSETVVRDLRTRQKPLHVAHLLTLPKRARAALLALLDDAEIDAA